MDDAPSERPPPRKRWLNRNIAGMGLASLFSDMNHEMATAVLPVFLATVLGAPAFALGVIEGVADGVSTFFEVWSGWYSDRIGRRKGLAAFGYLVTALSKATFAFATNWWHVLAGRTAGWIGWSIRSPVRDALLTESTTDATVGRAFAFHRTMDTLGGDRRAADRGAASLARLDPRRLPRLVDSGTVRGGIDRLPGQGDRANARDAQPVAQLPRLAA